MSIAYWHQRVATWKMVLVTVSAHHKKIHHYDCMWAGYLYVGGGLLSIDYGCAKASVEIPYIIHCIPHLRHSGKYTVSNSFSKFLKTNLPPHLFKVLSPKWCQKVPKTLLRRGRLWIPLRHLKRVIFMVDTISNKQNPSWLLQGLFKNDFPGLSFENFLLNGVPIGPNLSGTYVVEQIYGIQNNQGRWTDFGIVVAMIIIYRILFFIFIKLNEKYGQRVLALVAQYRNGKSMAHKDLTSEESSTKFA